MNILKALFLTSTLFLYMDLEFSVVYAMQDVEPTTDLEESDEMLYESSWQKLIVELSKKEDCSGLDAEWLNDAIEYAQEVIEDDNETIDQLADELDNTMRKLCGDTETNRIKKEFKNKLEAWQLRQQEETTTQPAEIDINNEEGDFLQPEEQTEQDETEISEMGYEPVIFEQKMVEPQGQLLSEWDKCLKELQEEDDPIKFNQAIKKAHDLAKQLGIPGDELEKQFKNAINARMLTKESDPFEDTIETLIKDFNEDISHSEPQNLSTQPLPEAPVTETYTPIHTVQTKEPETISLPVYQEPQINIPHQQAQQPKQQNIPAEQLVQQKQQLEIQAKRIKVQEKQLKLKEEENRMVEQLLAEQQKAEFRIALAEKLTTEKTSEVRKGIISRLLGHEEEKKEVELPAPSKLYLTFEEKLGQVSVGWLSLQYAPSHTWQTEISNSAIELLKDKGIEIKDAFIMINKAIDNYDKTCWFHDAKKIAIAKNTIFELIHSGINTEFAEFLKNFKAIAAEDFSNGHNSLSWKYSQTDGSYYLQEDALNTLADDATRLIDQKIVTDQELETMMNIELQELRKVKIRVRPVKELGILEAIEKSKKISKKLLSFAQQKKINARQKEINKE